MLQWEMNLDFFFFLYKLERNDISVERLNMNKYWLMRDIVSFRSDQLCQRHLPCIARLGCHSRRDLPTGYTFRMFSALHGSQKIEVLVVDIVCVLTILPQLVI